MKVYLTSTTERMGDNKEQFRSILEIFRSLDIENSNPYLTSVVENKDKVPLPPDLYEVALKSVSNSDLLMVDITDQSISLGILIEFARYNNVPILCICEDSNQANIPNILTHKRNSQIFNLLIFNKSNLSKQLSHFLSSFKKNKVKFNVFISHEIDSYMKWAAKKRRYASKSDFFRDLIEQRMRDDPEYSR